MLWLLLNAGVLGGAVGGTQGSDDVAADVERLDDEVQRPEDRLVQDAEKLLRRRLLS